MLKYEKKLLNCLCNVSSSFFIYIAAVWLIWAMPMYALASEFAQAQQIEDSDISFNEKYKSLLLLLEDSETWSTEEQSSYFQWLGTAAGEIDKLEEAETYLTKSIVLIKDSAPSEQLAFSLLERSYFRYLDTGDTQIYCPDRFLAIDIARQLETSEMLLKALTQAAFCATDTKDFQTGLSLLKEALNIMEVDSIPSTDKGLIYNATGNIYRSNGLHERAYFYIKKAYDEWFAIQDYVGMFNMLHTLNAEAISLQQFEVAQSHVDKMFEMANANYAGIDFLFFANFNQGTLFYAQEKFEKAYASFLNAYELKETTVEQDFVNTLVSFLSFSAWYNNDFTSALEYANLASQSKPKSIREKLLLDGIIHSATSSKNEKQTMYRLLELDKYYRQKNSELLSNQIGVLSLEHDVVVTNVEKELLEKQLALSQLEIEKKQAEEEHTQFVQRILIIILGMLFLGLFGLFWALSYFKKMAGTDFLTGVKSRRAAFKLGEKIMHSNLEQDKEFSVLAIDVDHFKRINDNYGHHIGDITLKEIAKRLQNALRKKDILARIGGEEFLILLPNTAQTEATDLAQRLREKMNKDPINFDKRSLSITISIGVATNTSGVAFDKLIAVADNALYQAKETGRNKVVVADVASS
ncbi:GGDEF domain-containing protein [Glaciecola sp. 1036]|uniref:GGDEF domain-containing protein n=1 Tax=Alteromonadaceae TaxID=72275 RepID=UPI003CFE956D